MRVVMVGTGYVGLVSGVCFADFGHDVVCVDKDPSKIETLNTGGVPIFEPGLDSLIAKNVEAGRLSFTTDLGTAMIGAHAVFIAVGTPTRETDGHADLKYVYAAAEEIATHIKDFTVVVNKSTVPVGTGDEVEAVMAKTLSPDQFAVVSNPEFLREGAAIDDFTRPDRVVIGTDNTRAQQVMRDLYPLHAIGHAPILFTARRTSELIKYAANAFLATKIGFINEIADLCEAVGGDVGEVAKGIGLDTRIGSRFLRAGPGYGGSCFPKDTLALAKTADSYDVDLSIVDAVITSNNTRKDKLSDRVIAACGGDVSGKTIAVLGLSFKPNTDDMRYSPSLKLIPGLQAAGALIKAYDPEAMEEAAHLLSDVTYTDSVDSCITDADALVIVTEWDAFKALDPDALKSALKTPIVVDLRNIFNAKDMVARGFTYRSIGRP